MKLKALLHSKLFIGVTAAVVAAGGIAAGLFLKKRPESYRVIKVFEVAGDAVVKRASVGELDPYSGMNLESGDNVATFEDGSLRMILDDTKYIRMEPETDLELTSSGNASDNKTCIVLKSGSILNEITQSLSVGSSYEVTAPKATMAVVGTSFRVNVEKDENGDYVIKLYVFHGNVKVDLLDENGNKTGRSETVGEDKCVIIKTVRKENSRNDPSVDGFSFFVYEDEEGNLTAVPDGKSPLLPIDYFSIPYETLKDVFDTDKDDEIKLYSAVLEKVIEAMNGKKEDPPAEQKPGDKKSDGGKGKDSGDKGGKDEKIVEGGGEGDGGGSDNGSGEPDNPDPPADPEGGNKPDPEKPDKPEKPVNNDLGGTQDPPAPPENPQTPTTPETPTNPETPPAPPETPSSPPSDNTVPPREMGGGGSGDFETPSGNGNNNFGTGGGSGSITDSDNGSSGSGDSGGDNGDTPPDDTPTRYKVTFYDYDGSIYSVQAVEEGKNANEPTLSDYTGADGGKNKFGGWNISTRNVTKNLSVYPKFTTYYTVTFHDKDGNVYNTPTEVVKGGSVTAPTLPDYTGADGGKNKFGGWDTDTSNVTENLSVYPKFTTYYTVTFHDKDGNVYNTPTEVVKGGNVTAPTLPDYTGADGGKNKFGGWDTDTSNVTKNLSVYPKFTTYYTVTFHDKDGNVYGTPVEVVKGGSVTAPTLSGYTDSSGIHKFTGWDTPTSSVNANLDVYPKFDTYHTVTFHKADNTVYGEPIEVIHGGSVDQPELEDYENEDGDHRFAGWDTPTNNVTADLDVYPKFDTYHTVTFHNEDETVYGTPIKVLHGGSVDQPVLEGYENDDGDHRFAGWDTPTDNVTSDLNVFPKFDIYHTVTFYDQNEEVYGTPVEVIHGGSVDQPTLEIDPDENGRYEFVGWNQSTNNVTANMDVFPIIDTYFTVTFYKRNGTVYSEEEVLAGGSVEQPTLENEDNGAGTTYIFTGWDTDTSEVMSNLEVKPNFDTYYTVKFYGLDETTSTDVQVKENEAAEKPADPTYLEIEDGVKRTFKGWKDLPAAITEPTDVYPDYTTSYKVTFLQKTNEETPILEVVWANEGISLTNHAADPDSYYADTDNTIRKKFESWDTDLSEITAPMTVEPIYSTAYKVVFLDAEEVQIGEAQFVEEGEDAVAPAMPEKIGDKEFGGWDKEYTNITESVTVKAVYGTKVTIALNAPVGLLSEGEDAVLPNKAISGSRLTLPEHVTDITNFNVGWFHAYSGEVGGILSREPLSDEVITVNSDYMLNNYFLFMYSDVEVVSSNQAAHVDTYHIRLLCSGNSLSDYYLCLTDDNYPDNRRTERFDSLSDLFGISIESWRFCTSDSGNTLLEYGDVIEKISNQSDDGTPIAITTARYEPGGAG